LNKEEIAKNHVELNEEKEPNIPVTFNKIQIGGSELGSGRPTGASTRKEKDPTAYLLLQPTIQWLKIPCFIV